MIIPNSNIYLLKCNLQLDNLNQLTFSSISSQLQYFNNLPKLLLEDATYQRKDNVIRYPGKFDDIENFNYCMYQNENYSNKWFFAYVTNMRYVNDNMTEISIVTDVFQTWQFDISYKRCFVEREMVSDDTIGKHTVPENVNTGDVICEYSEEDVSLSEYTWVAIASSWNPATEKQFDGITIYNNQVFGYQIHIIEAQPISNLLNLLLYLQKTNADKHIEDIQDVFIIPDALINKSALTPQHGTIEDNSFDFYILPFSTDPASFTTTIPKLTTFKGFTPKNNKCFVYPYNYLFATNNIGNNAIYKYENFSGNNATFITEVAISVGASGQLVPLNYKGNERDDDEAIPLAKYPTCGWSTDSYINWLTQNAINLPTQILNFVTNPISTALNSINPMTFLNNQNPTGNAGLGLDLTLSQVNKASNLLDQFYQAQLLPSIQGSKPVGNIAYSAKRNTFTIKQMHSKIEYLKIIDDFFSRFGYKINELKVPNINNRPNWNYIKTVDSIITGNIPQGDLQIIKNMFNNGVTLWHNPSTFLDYSQNNK